MSGYKGPYQRSIEKYIASEAPTVFINWINMSNAEAESGGADRITELLLAAGYRPEGANVVDSLRDNYVNGVKGEDGKYIRLPQEYWQLQKFWHGKEPQS